MADSAVFIVLLKRYRLSPVKMWPDFPTPGVTHVWMCEGIMDARLDDCLERLGSEEQERARAFRFDRDRRRFAGSRLLVRAVLAHYLDCDPQDLSFERNEWGKPVLTDRGGPTLHFNLSRSCDLALLGVSRSVELGVDVEKCDERRSGAEIADRHFAPAEQEFIARAADATLAFFEIWSRKEAYIKAIGRGLSHPLSTFSVAPDGRESEVRDWSEQRPASRWSIQSLDLPVAGYAAALATEGPLPAIEMITISGEELIDHC